jgi:hypothetical protein
LAVVVLAMHAGVAASGSPAAAPQPRTTAAYDAYVADVEAAFLARARARAPIAAAPSGVRPQRVTEGRIVGIAHGLVHHWRSRAHIPHVGLERVIATAQRYDAYARIHAPIIESRLLCRDANRFRILTRVRERAGPVTVVLEVRSVVRFERDATSAYSIGASLDIHEVVAAGEPGERLLPAGRDRGYLWRAHTFTRFVERAGGVDVELETIGLSRRFPAMLGWLIEPIARRLGQRSVERTLAEFAVAVRDGIVPEPEPTGGGLVPTAEFSGASQEFPRPALPWVRARTSVPALRGWHGWCPSYRTRRSRVDTSTRRSGPRSRRLARGPGHSRPARRLAGRRPE